MSGFRLELMLYIPHCKYQVKPRSSLLFSAACAAAIVHRNHFFPPLYQQNKSSESESLDRLVICNYSQRVLEAAKLPYTNKTKESILCINLAPGTFGKLLIVF